MAYRVILDLCGSTGRLIEPALDVYHFQADTVDLPCPESFIPARDDTVLFKHEGRWWKSRVQGKTLAIIPGDRDHRRDYLITLVLGLCWEERYEPSL